MTTGVVPRCEACRRQPAQQTQMYSPASPQVWSEYADGEIRFNLPSRNSAVLRWVAIALAAVGLVFLWGPTEDLVITL